MKGKKMKLSKALSVVTAIATLISTTSVVPLYAEETGHVHVEENVSVQGNVCYMNGDVNSDGTVTEEDALYVLYHSVYPEDYPLYQNGNVDGDENNGISVKDAYYVLSHKDDTAFAKQIHVYDEPIVSWTVSEDNTTAKAVAEYRCACGLVDKHEVAATIVGEPTVATCTTAGGVTFEAVLEHNGVTKTVTKTVESPALGHDFADGVLACTDGLMCSREGCGYKEVEPHNYGESGPVSTPATCTEPAKETYTCVDCGHTYTNIIGTAAGHTLEQEVKDWVLVAGETCKYNPVYHCSTCEEDITVELEADKVAVRHDYKATIVEPTCNTEGQKIYTCTACGDSYTDEKPIPVNENAHKWDEGVEADGITTYTCTVCDGTKTAINAKAAATTGAVDADTVKAAGEAEVSGTSIKLDENTIAALPEAETIEISATPTDKSSLAIPEELKSQIGEVYDFNIKADGQLVSDFNGGKVTVSIPYELSEGEDPDNIEVWYINGDQVENCNGVYANGYVTFETGHFSYYTVTRLTPAQRCEKYGHSETSRVVAPTCEEDGYTMHVCIRCGKTWEDAVVPTTGHNLTVEETPATCISTGVKKEVCSVEGCGYNRETTIPELGHNFELTDSKAATCSEAGYEKYKCANADCDAVKEKTIEKLEHAFTTVTTEVTCVTKGQTVHTCDVCGHVEVENEKPATGHDFEDTWTWKNKKASVKLVCKNPGCKEVVTRDVKNKEIVKEATCENDGSIKYIATVVYNGVTYEDEKVEEIKAYKHKPSGEWGYNAEVHYLECKNKNCDERIDEEPHTLDKGTVIKAATCTEAGEKKFECKCGYTTKETIQALGHDLVKGVCTRCGYKSNECTHDSFTQYVVDLKEEYGACGGTFTYMACDCGESKVFVGYDLRCDFDYSNEVTKDENGYVSHQTTMTCKTCNNVFVEESHWEVLDGCKGISHMTFTVSDKDNNVLFEFDGRDPEIYAHPVVVYKESIDLASLGFCGGTVVNATCECGEIETFFMNGACEFIEIPEECTEDKYVAACAKCGIKLVNTYGFTPLEGCTVSYYDTYTYYKDGAVVLTLEDSRIGENHNYKYDFELEVEGGTCSDGYIVNATCKDCNYTFSYTDKALEGQHKIYWAPLDVSEYDLCVDTVDLQYCPCGEIFWSNLGYQCNMNWTYSQQDTETGWIEIGTGVCADCGLSVEQKSVYTENPDSCAVDFVRTRTCTKDDKEIITTYETGLFTSHNSEVIDYEVKGDSCEDGVVLTYECQNCKEVYTDEVSWHKDIVVERHDLSEYGICGGTVTVTTCPCETYQYIREENAKCTWENYHDTTLGLVGTRCTTCGIFKAWSNIIQRLEGCNVIVNDKYTYYNGSTPVFSVEINVPTELHKYVCTFEMDGESCSDGYRESGTCAVCGDTYSAYAKPIEGVHWTYITEYVDLKANGFCGGYVSKNECPCGENSSMSWDSTCNFVYVSYDEERNTYTYRCEECGGSYKISEELDSQEGCSSSYIITYEFYNVDMELVATAERTQVRFNHVNTYEFDMGEGTTCSDGYTLISTCTVCGEKTEEYMKPEVGSHPTYSSFAYDLKDYGFCGMKYDHMTCPCGRYDTYALSSIDCTLSNVYDEELGVYKSVCSTCGNYSFSEVKQDEPEGCYTKYYTTVYFYTKDGEKVLEFTNIVNVAAHDMTYGYEDVGESCTDGFTQVGTCKKCGEITRTPMSYHAVMTTKEQDLTEYGGCEGLRVLHGSCPCGQMQAVDLNYWETCNVTTTSDRYVEDGVEHIVSVVTCSECGLHYKEDQVTVLNTDNCIGTTTEKVTIAIGETAVDAFEISRTQTIHVLEESVELADGATNCNEGVVVTQKCKNCDYTNTYNTSGHYSMVKESIDLSEYGATCGGNIVYRSCPCGELAYVSLENVECDLDVKSGYDLAWIGEDYEGQNVMNFGWFDPEPPMGYTYKCALTDPACDFSARRCTYYEWDKTTCQMICYDLWQFGCEYDEDGNFVSCEKELKIKQNTQTYHDYTTDISTEDNVTTRTDTCNTCGSTEIIINKYDADGHVIYTENTYENLLNNGKNKYSSSRSDYVWYQGYQFATNIYMKNIDANDNTSWDNWEYSYNFEDFDCKREYTYTNSYGESNKMTEVYHPAIEWKYETVKTPTCSQFGIYRSYNPCVFCGKAEYDETYDTNPYKHNWTYNYTTEMYECYNCGLENENGATGTIVFEDMSEEYGKGTDFVVGYWNQSNVQFIYNLSVILGDEHDIVLSGIKFTELTRDKDGITAITFDKQAAIDAAIAALEAEGCTDTTGYELRFAFVPQSSDGNLDYAITFTAEDLEK